MAHRLISQPKNYDWGVPGALSKVLGREPSISREAEIWWGNHPLAECLISTHDGLIDFPSWLDQSGTHFPLLAKLLAARQPLSIQVHPSHEQAERGFEDEEQRGIPLDARERTYKDRSAKPELLIALSDEFVALVGFAGQHAVSDRLERWVSAGAPRSLVAVMEQVAGDSSKAAGLIVRQSSQVEGLVQELETWLSSLNLAKLERPTLGEVRLLQRISAAHPGDSGILFVLLMHHVYLHRGGAVFVPAGEVHGYVEGMGLEVMLPSDNVIRAGLTSKHKDVEAFLELGDFTHTASPRLVTPVINPAGDTYEDFGAKFAVHRMSFGCEGFMVSNPTLCFVESGEALVSDSEAITLRRGEAALVLPGATIAPESVGALLWVVHADLD